MKTPYVDITTLRNGDEKRYWFKQPKGETLEQAAQKAMEIIHKDIMALGRDPKDYDYLIGDNGDTKTMTAVYNPTRKPMNEMERFREWKKVKEILK